MPTDIEIGQRVKVNAHGNHEEDFSGVVVAIDSENYLAWVKAPDDEIYGCTLAFVEPWPEENVIFVTVEGGVIQDVSNIPAGFTVRVIDHDGDARELTAHDESCASGEGAEVNDWQ